jgi:hypothetical protein
MPLVEEGVNIDYLLYIINTLIFEPPVIRKDLLAEIYNVTDYGEVIIYFSEPILMPPGETELAPNNKISRVFFQDQEGLEDPDTFYRPEQDKEVEEELPFVYNYTYMNATTCLLKLDFKE